MLRLKEFKLFTPETIEEVISLIVEKENSVVLAGGTDIIPKLKRGQYQPDCVISLSKMETLDFIEIKEEGTKIGAMTMLNKLRELGKKGNYRVISQTAEMIASPMIRNSATIGGNLLQGTRCRYFDRSRFWREAMGHCLKGEGDECKIAPGGKRCYAVFCSDLAPLLITLDAEIKLKGEKERVIPLESLYRDNGMEHLDIKGEILTEVFIPRNSYAVTYKKLRIREGIDFPEAGVAVALKNNDGGKLKLNIAVTGVCSGIAVFRKEIDKESIREIPEEVYSSVRPMDNLCFPPLYRKKMMRNFLEESLNELTSY